jgi:hypothetical protein
MEKERNNIVIRAKNKVHSQGGYFTERHRFLGRGRKERMRKLSRDFDFLYNPLRFKEAWQRLLSGSQVFSDEG